MGNVYYQTTHMIALFFAKASQHDCILLSDALYSHQVVFENGKEASHWCT